jgi:hypothetical protein
MQIFPFYRGIRIGAEGKVQQPPDSDSFFTKIPHPGIFPSILDGIIDKSSQLIS